MIKASKHRSRRLRKKLRLAEFVELGFPVEFRLAPRLTEEQLDAFWDAFIVEAIEANALIFGGGEIGYVCATGRRSASDLARTEVQSWLAARPEVTSVAVGALEDSWYGPAVGPDYSLKQSPAVPPATP